MSNIDRERRRMAGPRLLAQVAFAGGKVAERLMTSLSKEAGYLDGRGWPRYLSGKAPYLKRTGDGLIVLTERGLRRLGDVYLRRSKQ